jgi:hypothetical protein
LIKLNNLINSLTHWIDGDQWKRRPEDLSTLLK